MKKFKDVIELRTQLNELMPNIDGDADADWIISTLLNIKRSEIRKGVQVPEKICKKAYKLAKMRSTGKPLTQILSNAEFFGYKFFVNQEVLSPRFETELLVDTVSKFYKSGVGLDIGTGSGVIAISLNKHFGLEMYASDISKSALKVAKKNQVSLNTNVKFILSDMFKQIGDLKFDFIVSNPPYIRTEVIKTLDPEVQDHEPIIALDGGSDGLKFYRIIAEESPKFLKEGGMLFLEIGYDQAEEVENLLKPNFKDIQVKKDYSGKDRIVYAYKK